VYSVCGCSCAKSCGRGGEINGFGYLDEVGGFTDGVLLKCTVDRVSCDFSFGTICFRVVQAMFTVSAGTVNPLPSIHVMRREDVFTDVVSNFKVMDVISHCNDNSGTFVTTN